MAQARLLRELRGERKLSQGAVAKALHVSRPTYVALEQGKRELTLSEAERLSRMYDISFESIFAGKRQKVFLEVKRNTKDVGRVKRESAELRISVPAKNYERFKQVLLYVLEKVGSRSNIGMTALYKLLYFIDFDYYEKFEEQLMGAAYMRNHYGPTPVAFQRIVKEMEKENLIEEVETKYFQHDQKKFLPRIKSDLSQLSGRDIEHIDETLARLGDKIAHELTELSHRDVPWLSAGEGELLDYESVFYRTPETSVRTYESDTL